MLLATLLVEYQSTQKLRGKVAKTTQTNYVSNLRRYVRWHTEPTCLADFTTKDVQDYCDSMSDKCPRSVRMAKASLHHFGEWLLTKTLLSTNPVCGIQMPRIPTIRRKPVPDDIVGKMLDACGKLSATAYHRVLARAMISTLAMTGLRLSEMLALQMGDIMFTDDYVQVVHGKGGKDREVFVCKEYLQEMKAFLRQRPKDCTHEYILAYDRGKRLAHHGVYQLIKQIKEAAGVPDVRITPHMLRHSYATRQSDNGVPIAVIQANLGHENIMTTAKYIHKPSKAAQRQWSEGAALNYSPSLEASKGAIPEKKKQSGTPPPATSAKTAKGKKAMPEPVSEPVKTPPANARKAAWRKETVLTASRQASRFRRVDLRRK